MVIYTFIHTHTHTHTTHTHTTTASTETRKHQPKTYMIHAGTEPEQFINMFPFWKPNSKVQDIQCKVHVRTNVYMYI